MDGKDAILKKIMTNAESRCEKIIAAAQATANETLEKAKLEAAKENQSVIEVAKLQAANLIEGKIQTASREAKRSHLSISANLIDDAFSKAKEKVLNFTNDEYKKFVVKLLIALAENGETVTVGRKDVNIITDDVLSETKLKLKLNAGAGDFERGVMLSKGSYDKNLSLEMLLREAREKFETSVLAKLVDAK